MLHKTHPIYIKIEQARETKKHFFFCSVKYFNLQLLFNIYFLVMSHYSNKNGPGNAIKPLLTLQRTSYRGWPKVSKSAVENFWMLKKWLLSLNKHHLKLDKYWNQILQWKRKQKEVNRNKEKTLLTLRSLYCQPLFD